MNTEYTFKQLEITRKTWLKEHAALRTDLRTLSEVEGDIISGEFRYPHDSKLAYRWATGDMEVTRYPDIGSLHIYGIGDETKVRIIVKVGKHKVANYTLTNNPSYDYAEDFIVQGKWMEDIRPYIIKALDKENTIQESASRKQAQELAEKLLIGVDI